MATDALSRAGVGLPTGAVCGYKRGMKATVSFHEVHTVSEMLDNFPLVRKLYPEIQFPAITEEAYPAMLEEMARHGYKQLTAQRDGRVVGLAGFYTSMVPYMGGRVLKLVDLIVSEDCRGQGLAKLLLEAVETEGRRQGCCKLVLETAKHRDDTIRFYRKRSFDEPRVLFERPL